MTVTLTPHLEELVKQKVDSGLYSSPSEVVREALRLLDERDRRLLALRRDIAVGVEQIERGEYRDFDERTVGELFDEVRTEGTRRLEAERRNQG